MAQFIKADDGRYINVDHIWEIVPIFRETDYIIHYPGTDDDNDGPAFARVSGVQVRKLVGTPQKPFPKKAPS